MVDTATIHPSGEVVGRAGRPAGEDIAEPGTRQYLKQFIVGCRVEVSNNDTGMGAVDPLCQLPDALHPVRWMNLVEVRVDDIDRRATLQKCDSTQCRYSRK